MMPKEHEHENHTERAAQEKGEARLKSFFDHIALDVFFHLFTRAGENDAYNEAARQVLRAFRKLTPRIRVQEHQLGGGPAKKWKIEFSPTLLIDPDHYRIRWLGAPVGEETQTLIEAIGMAGYDERGLSEESLRVLKRISSPRQIRLFVSPTCPYCPQQAVNALKAAMERPDLISLEIIDVQAAPRIADRYSAQAVPLAYANEKLIARGAQPEELFMASLEKLEEQAYYIPETNAAEVEADLVIVGGGPAGLAAGIYAARSGLKTVILERGLLGGQVATTPLVENYPGLAQVGGKTLVDVMVSHALEYTGIFPGEEAMEVQPGEPILVVTNRRHFKTRALLLATGATYRRLNVPGETRFSGRGVSYCSTCDGPLFSGKKVFMIGGGNSAVTEALYLHNIGVEVTLVHRGDALRAQEHLVKSLLDNGIPVLFNTEVKEIAGSRLVEEVVLYSLRTGETTHRPADGVFVAIGYEPNTQLARKMGVEIGPDGYIRHDEGHRTNVPGIYSAGDVEGGYKQIVIAAGKGSEAALSIFEDLINPYWKRKKSPEDRGAERFG